MVARSWGRVSVWRPREDAGSRAANDGGSGPRGQYDARAGVRCHRLAAVV
jgi:hypothetical protein